MAFACQLLFLYGVESRICIADPGIDDNYIRMWTGNLCNSRTTVGEEESSADSGDSFQSWHIDFL